MATNDKESKNQEEYNEKTSQLNRPVSVGVAAGAGVLLLLAGTAAGFTVSRMFDHGRDSRPGLAGTNNVGGNIASGMRGGTQGRMMGGIYGKVTSVSSSSITLTDNRSGGSITYKIDSNTDVNDNNGDNAKVSDIKVGDTVSVRGTSANDDTVADTIVINPSIQ